MADITCVYTLTSGTGTVVFNDGADDEYYLTKVTGLEDAPIRNPQDLAPQTSGSIHHDWFEEGLHPTFEGILLIRSTRIGNSVRVIRNTMMSDLRVCLRGMLGANTGSIAWTPYGLGAHSLTVKYEVPLDPDYVDNYLNMSFSFGLASEDSAPS